MSSALESLKQFTVVVADTGDFEAIVKYRPVDATTNPSLILAAAQLPQYSHLVDEAIAAARKDLNAETGPEKLVERAYEHLVVAFGTEILKIVPGRVSTEVRAALSYDSDATIAEARALISMYAAKGIPKERVLIKIASTWEGIQAAQRLEAEDSIHCNLTLLFSLAQAVACAEASVTLISPFVGRILDWHKRATGKEFSAAEDPGVVSVTSIYNYLKRFNYRTVVMGASFRTVGEIEELAGIDYLTISPALLDQLANRPPPLERRLSPEKAIQGSIERLQMDRAVFDEMMAADHMASELLRDGIKKFDEDAGKVLAWIKQRL